eukprot:1409900-Amphidinium_carterae.1
MRAVIPCCTCLQICAGGVDNTVELCTESSMYQQVCARGAYILLERYYTTLQVCKAGNLAAQWR